MNKKINVVFAPYSFISGMAGANRLAHIYKILSESERIGKISNLVFRPNCDEYPQSLLSQYKCQYYPLAHRNNPLVFIKQLVLLFLFLKKDYDRKSKNVVLFYGYISLENFFVVAFAKLIGYKIIVDIVEDRSLIKSYKGLKNKIKIKSSIYFLNRIKSYSSGLITISDYLLNKLSILTKNSNQPIYFLPITVDFEFFNNVLRETENKEDEKVIKVFYGGSFASKDGLEFLFEALSRVVKKYPNIILYMTGKGDDRDMGRVFSEIKNLGIDANVHYLGFLSRTEYYSLIQTCDLFCITRTNSDFAHAGFPFKLGEFLATGKPVLCSSVGDISKYLDDKSAFLVSPESVDEIEEVLLKFITCPQKYSSLGQKGAQVAKNHFDYKNYSQSFIEFLYKIVAN